jgi:hypothetical protein
MGTDVQAPVSGRRLIFIAVLAACVGAFLMLSFIYADHAPEPHGVRIAVVAPPGAAQRVAGGLDRAAPGAFTVTDVASARAARAALRGQKVRGALVLGPGRDAEVLTAGAAGTALSEVIDTALSRAAGAAGRRPVPVDVVPLPAADRAGLAPFVFELGLLIPSVIGSVGLYLIGLRSRLWWRVAAAVLYALLVSVFGTLVIATGFGALSGSWAAVCAIGVLGALAFILPVSAAQTTFGLPGTGLMAIVLIFVGNAVSGGSVPTGMLPGVYRQISPWLPNGAIVHAIRAVVYFDGNGLGQPLLALAVWIGGAVLVLALIDIVHGSERRRSPGRAAEIYATTGLDHARRIARRRRITRRPTVTID